MRHLWMVMVGGLFATSLGATQPDKWAIQSQESEDQRFEDARAALLRETKALEEQQWERKNIDQKRDQQRRDDAQWNKRHGRL